MRLDLSRFTDVTKIGETETVVTEETDAEIRRLQSKTEEFGGRLIGVISDSAPDNCRAKKVLSAKFPGIVFLPCFAHQLNHFAGNILVQESTKETVQQAEAIVNFFQHLPKADGLPQRHHVYRIRSDVQLHCSGKHALVLALRFGCKFVSR